MDFSKLIVLTAKLLPRMLVAVCFCFVSIITYAADIYILPSRPSGPHAAVAKQIKASLSKSVSVDTSIHVLYPSQRTILNASAGPDDLIVTVGTDTLSEILESGVQARILATLVPRPTYETLIRKHNRPDGSVSAVFIEQSYQRSIDLARIALPNRTAGILVGSRSTDLYRRLVSFQQSSGNGLYLKKMRPGDNLIAALDQVLKRSKVFIAYADPEVSNRNTAQHILLTTYRHGIPVIAYSRAYVKAGAMMAVYSTPEQYAAHAAELVLASRATDGNRLPAPQYPRYFSVEVNKNVARSLGIRVPAASVLEQRLRNSGGAGE